MSPRKKSNISKADISEAKAPVIKPFIPKVKVKAHEIEEDSFSVWMDRAGQSMEKDSLRCKARAYTAYDGFLPFCIDICGHNKLNKRFHTPISQVVTGMMVDDYERVFHYSNRMVLVARGFYKSTLGSIDYPAWRIARDFVQHNFEQCTIQIGLASERAPLAKAHVSAVRRNITSKRFKELFGDHRPETRWGGGKWASDSFTSVFQNEAITKDPTVSMITLGAEQTGFHFHLIIADDLQAYSSSYNRDQLEKTDELYRLLYGLFTSDDTGTSSGEMLVIGTRWAKTDIYGTILKENKEAVNPKNQFVTMEVPAEVDTRPTFPEQFPREVLEQKRKNMKGTYAPQMLLKPLAEEDRVFDVANLVHRTEQIDLSLQNKAMRYIVGVDPAWISQDMIARGDADSKAYSVIVTIGIDAAYNIYIMDLFRRRVGREALVDEIWRQYEFWGGWAIAFQTYDFKHLSDEIRRKEVLSNIYPRKEWLPGSKQSKEDRIQGTLEGLVGAHKLFIPNGAEWLEDEFRDFPFSDTFDGLDAITNAIKLGRAPMELVAKQEVKTDAARWIDDLLEGKLGVSDKDWTEAY